MNGPLSYFGGKKKLAPLIVSLFPRHTLYAEPFAGGAAVFFLKAPSRVELLNDINGEIMNFYQVLKNNFKSLQTLVQQTPHSRNAFRQAFTVHHNPDMFDRITRAWAVWVLVNQSFGGKMEYFGYDKRKSDSARRIKAQRDHFLDYYRRRLEKVELECADALYIIQSRDAKDTFFYCDPPYPGTESSFYSFYSERDFEVLLKTLSTIQGKFLLSSYPYEILSEYTQACHWQTLVKDMDVALICKRGQRTRKTEVLTANFSLMQRSSEMLF